MQYWGKQDPSLGPADFLFMTIWAAIVCYSVYKIAAAFAEALR